MKRYLWRRASDGFDRSLQRSLLMPQIAASRSHHCEHHPINSTGLKAWVSQGQVWAASAPLYVPVRLTGFERSETRVSSLLFVEGCNQPLVAFAARGCLRNLCCSL